MFNSSALMYRPPKELCAGFKIPYPKMKVFIRKKKRNANETKAKDKKEQSYVFKYVTEQKNPVS